MTRRLYLICMLSVVLSLLQVRAQEDDKTKGKVHSIRFDAPCSMPVSVPKRGYEGLVKVMKFGAETLPEGTQIAMALTLFPKRLGLTDQQAATLRDGFAEVYARIAEDPGFAGVTSVLKEGFDDDPNRDAHYFVYIPGEVTEHTRTLVFLHGSGGNFLFSVWLLKEMFPDSVIIFPTWGTSWRYGNVEFIDAACKDAATRSYVMIDRRWLMGLSAGGPAGFRALIESGETYQGYICLASAPESDQIDKLATNKPILMLAGIKDGRFPIRSVRECFERMKPQNPNLELVEMNADHFFLLTQRNKTASIIKDFMARHDPQASLPQTPSSGSWLIWGISTVGGVIMLGIVGVVCRMKRKQGKGTMHDQKSP